jgi:hypothetical protein
VKKRLPFLIVLGLGFVLWRGGFGFLPIERTLTWRFPVKYADVRRVELQVWDGDQLVKREEQQTPAGLTSEPSTKLPLTRGPHRAVGVVWLEHDDQRTFQAAFDPASDPNVVVSFAR